MRFPPLTLLAGLGLGVGTTVGAAAVETPAPGPAATGTPGPAATPPLPKPIGFAIAPGRTTTIRVEPPVGKPLEREPLFTMKLAAYRRAIDMDAGMRWFEATGLYQQALGELGAAAAIVPPALLELATLKIDQERRRSRALAQTGPAAMPAEDGAPTASRPTAKPREMPPLERGRLLRLKLMAVRAATGAVPAGLLSATLGALGQALRGAGSPAPPPVPDARDERLPASRAEARLLLCATRAAAGDHAAARLELAHVARADRLDPARAIAAATCQAGLGHDDEALASLAVAIFQLGPSSRLLPGQAREIHGANDWDRWRGDPRFEELFR